MTGALPKQEMTSPPGHFVSCYVASKLIHATKIMELRNAWPKIYFTARWPVVRDLPSEKMRPARHWLLDNVDDILRSQTVLVYAEKEDRLKTALVEVGIAWRSGIPIHLVGYHDDYAKWRNLPRITRHGTLDAALTSISKMADYPKEAAT